MLDCRVVQQGAWDMPLESMPLAAGYLKATIDADTELSAEVQVRIQNFRGGVPLPEMAGQIFRDGLPDVIAFSVLGWNYRNFGFLADTYKQLHPAGLVVFGGNHVANQGQRTFRDFPSVDIVVNGEGEFTLRDILLANLDGHDLHEVAGITVQTPDGQHFDTPERTRIDQLDVVRSPFLTGSIPMLDGAGHFRYDVSLMETNAAARTSAPSAIGAARSANASARSPGSGSLPNWTTSAFTRRRRSSCVMPISACSRPMKSSSRTSSRPRNDTVTHGNHSGPEPVILRRVGA